MNENEYKVLNIILKNKKITSKEISEKINISQSYISKIIKKLKEKKYIKEIIKKENKNIKKFKIDIKDKKILGISFSDNFFDITLSTITGELLKTKRKKFFLKKSNALLDLLIKEIDLFFKTIKKEDIIGIGIIINSPIDENGNIIKCKEFNWDNLNLNKIVNKKYGIPVIIENSISAILNANLKFSNLSEFNDLLHIHISDIVGSSIMINKKILNNTFGGIKHYYTNFNSKLICKCGSRECINVEFSENNIKFDILNLYEKKLINNDISDLEMKDIYNLNNEIVDKVIENKILNLGMYVLNIVKVLGIENILVSGDITNYYEKFYINFKKGINNENINVKLSEIKENLSNLASISIIMDNLFDNLKLI